MINLVRSKTDKVNEFEESPATMHQSRKLREESSIIMLSSKIQMIDSMNTCKLIIIRIIIYPMHEPHYLNLAAAATTTRIISSGEPQ